MLSPAAIAPAPTTSPLAFSSALDEQAPIIDALKTYGATATVPFSTPGHKRGAGLDSDLRQLLGSRFGAADVWLNTADHDRSVRLAEDLAARTWGADRSFFLVNGSSSGNQAFLLASLSPGDEVVVGRDLHQSLLAALILTGARPIYVAPRLHSSLHVGLGVAARDVVSTLDAHPAAKLVAVTSPTYWGVASNLREIVTASHTRGVTVYVDEAWGAHLGFHPCLPPSAMSCGADGAVTSPHKLLTGLSQAALLNIRGPRVDAARVAGAVKLTQTTSPLMPVLASLDGCRRQMGLAGRDMLDRTIELAERARRELRRLPGIDVLDASSLGLPPEQFDPTRLVIDVESLGLTGYIVERLLRERFQIAPEMSDRAGIVCLVTVGDTPETIQRLVRAVASLPHRAMPRSTATCPRIAGEAIATGEQALTPREAYFAPSVAAPLLDTVGEVAAEAVIPYPPGIPVLTPGEIITAIKIDCLREGIAAGMHVRGAADPSLQTLRIVRV
jgi:lysine decarboxylase